MRYLLSLKCFQTCPCRRSKFAPHPKYSVNHDLSVASTGSIVIPCRAQICFYGVSPTPSQGCRLLRFVGIFYKIRNKLPSMILKSIYFAFVHPHLLYGIELYANTSSSHLSNLETLNNKLLRILQNKPYNSPSKELYVEYNTLSIPDMHTQQILMLVHKFIYHKHCLPIVFSNYFELNIDVHKYDTRESNDLHVTAINKNYGKRSIKHKSSILWNKLPNAVKGYSSIKSFNKRLKAFLQSPDTFQ